MNSASRRISAIMGGILTAGPIGFAVDAAGVTADNDGDMGLYGLVAGLGLGLLVSALVREPDGQ